LSERLISLPVLPARPDPPEFGAPLEALRAMLLGLDEDAAAAHFSLDDYDRLLKTTISLCPECLAHVPAAVFVRGGRVSMRKRCPEHAVSEAVVENDESFFRLSSKDRWGRRYAADDALEFPIYQGACGGGGCCGEEGDDDVAGAFAPQMSNKSCTVLVEVTNACNLECRVCYSDARGDRKLPLERFERTILDLIEAKGGLDSVQLTGGEAALHPEFWRMVEFLHRQPGVKKIYLPTNGIVFAKSDVAAKLAPFRDRLMVLLQFDGRRPETNRSLRDANPERIRDRVIANLAELEIQMQLTMTISLGVNDDEIGWVVDTGFAHDHIKVVALQPVTYSGRYELTQGPFDRMTLSDVVKGVAAQVRRRTKVEDFVPIPCSHPNCGWITLFVRRFGIARNVVRHVDLEKVMNRVANRTLLGTQELREVVGTKSAGFLARVATGLGRKLIRSSDVFGIAVKPFMDRFTYDLDRISACCHHILDTHGRPVSFCEYNARLRDGDSWSSFPLVTETETETER
jgi:tetraether lipid synthase